MMRSLWIAKTGMEAQQTQLDHISNNLANVSTNGYKRSQALFEDLMYQNLRQSGAAETEQTQLPTGLQVGLGVRTAATGRVFTQGNLAQSGNALDMAITGKGFFQIQRPDGTTAYTRDGTFKVDANGIIVTNNGETLMPGITVPPTALSVTVGSDGTVNVVLPGNPTPQGIGQVQLANFINPNGLDPLGGNLFAETASSGAPQVGAAGSNSLGTIKQGFVESSNVNVVEELVQMIQTQRAYELNSKAVQTSDQMLQRLSQI
ncbi:flagellar basal-body rod protein FlgG [Inhella gelatinilytica]|uniref:Flagellar basal-body rod protein FlgF n=1 Tax=Inhella gelatinilytica TaxID=2795030 RepID=A0A931IYQ6_9BURK|nr:flagellar basal-body rod protein FlgG [Inhella gelatinilytica]MBH9553544.1 flagellar basal-body rod protein FlgG [Inhella gelatinilytica]